MLTTQFWLTNPFDKKEPVEITGFYELSSGGRAVQALKWGGIFIAAAVFSIFLPVVHFFLVPLCTLLAPIMAGRAYFKHYYCPPVSFSCPDCRKPIQVQSRHIAMPHKLNCYECGSRWALVFRT